MNSLRISVRRAGSVFAAAALLLGTALPGIASAAQVTERSIALSTSAADADNVTYQVNFTATQTAGAVVIDFCSDSPLLATTCTPPVGFDVSGATAGGGFTKVGADTSTSKITVTGSVAASANTITLTGVNNPTSAGNLYARIVTYVDGAAAHNYTSANPGTHYDDGGVAMYITPAINVSAAVLESMIFCVTGTAAPGENCNLAGTTAPTLKLGENTGGVIALDAQHLSTGDLYTQLSTNAAGGAIVSLKSDTTSCGGLMRDGETDPTKGCGILPAGGSTFAAGTAKFGVKTATAVGAGTNFNGTLRPYDQAGGSAGTPVYNNTGYALRYASNNATGVTSTYGDPFLDTADAPVNNMGMTLTFGASAANNTPAGNYKAELSLIATGKF